MFEESFVYIASSLYAFLVDGKDFVDQPLVIWDWISPAAFFIILLFPAIKRLQDINLSKWFVLLLPLSTIYSYIKTIDASFLNETHGIVLSAISLFMYLFLFFKKGTEGPNQYGPDHLETNNLSHS